MTDLPANPWVVLLGWTLICAVWHTTLAAIALELWRVLRPSADADSRHTAAVVALVAACALTVTTPLGALTISIARPAPSIDAPASSGRSATSSEIVPVRDAQRVAPIRTDVSPSSVALIALVWLVGAAALLARLAAGWMAVGRITRRAALVDGGPLLDTFGALREQAEVPTARLSLSLDVEAPVVGDYARGRPGAPAFAASAAFTACSALPCAAAPPCSFSGRPW